MIYNMTLPINIPFCNANNDVGPQAPAAVNTRVSP